jgi:Uma2 family endonuclease
MVMASLAGEQRMVLQGVSWQTYERLVDELEGHGGIRLTYSRGTLELMTPSYSHDWIKKLIGRIIEAFTLELGIPLKSGGSTTFKRADLEKGLEPDECYWVQSEPRVRHKSEIDLSVDPPPDLAIEVEISRNMVDKLAVYAALGVPEVWRHDGTTLHVLTLGEAGDYEEVERSRALPSLPLVEIARVLDRREELDETSLLREFQLWVRRSFPDA